jgi:hypothetical protein
MGTGGYFRRVSEKENYMYRLVTIVFRLIENPILMFMADGTIVDNISLFWKLNISKFIREVRTKTK